MKSRWLPFARLRRRVEGEDKYNGRGREARREGRGERGENDGGAGRMDMNFYGTKT